MAVIGNNKKYKELQFPTEEIFENEIVSKYKSFFGSDTIYVDVKKKIGSKNLGGAIPDGLFFDFSDISDIKFYLVEVELAQHDFYKHIFPQITKFFAFYRSQEERKTLVEKIFTIVDSDKNLKKHFKKYIGKVEIFKFLNDLLENSQNILLILDGEKEELPEIIDTYTDTWGKLVKYITIKKYMNGKDIIYTVNPDYEVLDYGQSPFGEGGEMPENITEDFHLNEVNRNVRKVYKEVKSLAKSIDKTLVFNPQRYYVSIKTNHNIAYLKFRKTKLRFIAKLPERKIKQIVKAYPVVSLSGAVQNFYNGPCAAIDIERLNHKKEIKDLIINLISFG